MAQLEVEFPARGQGSGHLRTLIRKCPCIWTLRTLIQKCLHSPIPRLIQAVNAVHPICIKNQYENNNMLGLDTSGIKVWKCPEPRLELETRPLTEAFRIHNLGDTKLYSMYCEVK